jgi:hypothetical protein
MIDPRKYAEFLRNMNNPFADTDPERRKEDIVSFCARLWARTCEDRARQSVRPGEPPREAVRARAA